MWVIAKETQMGNYGRKEKGDKFNVTKSYGEQLVKAGLAEEAEGSEEETISVSTIPTHSSQEDDITSNQAEPEEAGTKPNPLTPEDVLVKVEKDVASTKEEKGIKSTK